MGKVGAIEALEEHGENDIKSVSHGETLWHFATAGKIVGAIDFLVVEGADVDAREYRQGRTPVHETSF